MSQNSQRAPGSKESGVSWFTVGVGLMGLLVGLAVGVMFAEGRAGSQNVRSIRADPAASEESHSASTSEAPLKRSKWRQRSESELRVESPPASIAVAPAVLVELTRADQPRLEDRVLLFSEGDPVAAALGMSADEKVLLEREWSAVKDAVVELQKESLHSQEQGEDLWVGADPFDGRELETRFRKSAIATLGAERGEAFLELTRAESAFGGWGQRPSVAYSIGYERQADGSLLYRITEKPTSDGPAGRSWISNRIPEHIRAITDELGIPPAAPGS